MMKNHTMNGKLVISVTRGLGICYTDTELLYVWDFYTGVVSNLEGVVLQFQKKTLI